MKIENIQKFLQAYGFESAEITEIAIKVTKEEIEAASDKIQKEAEAEGFVAIKEDFIPGKYGADFHTLITMPKIKFILHE